MMKDLPWVETQLVMKEEVEEMRVRLTSEKEALVTAENKVSQHQTW